MISVIITVKGGTKYLRRAVRSCLSQSEPPGEILLVGNGARKGWEWVVEGLPVATHNVKEPRPGPAVARNLGLDRAKGEYLQFLDDDDFLFHNSLQWRHKLANAFPRYSGVAGLTWDFLEDSQKFSPPKFVPSSRALNWSWVIRGGRLRCPLGSTLFQKKILEQVGPFDENLFSTDDWDLWLRLLKGHEVLLHPLPALAYRIRGDSLTAHNPRHRWESLLVGLSHGMNFEVPIG